MSPTLCVSMGLEFCKITTEGAIFAPSSKFPWTCPHEILTSVQAIAVYRPVNGIWAAECSKVGKFNSTLPWSPMGSELLVLCLIDGPG